MVLKDVDASGGRAHPERLPDLEAQLRDLGAGGPFRLRLRVPSPSGAPGTVSVEVQVGEPPQPVNGCQLLELVFGWGSSSDNGVVTSADAGSATLRLVDPLRLFDPANEESSFAGIGTVVRVLLNGATAFRGRIDDVQHDLTVATLALTDGIAELAGIQFVETSVPAQSSSARIVRILDLAGWPADRRDIGTGGRSLQAGTVSADAWTELLKVTRNELGTLWLTADGKVAWRNRTTAWSGAPLTEYVRNGSFEAMRDPAAQYPWPADWSGYPSESYMQTTAADPSFVVAGSRAFYVGTNGEGHFAYQHVALTPGVEYVLSAWGARFNTYGANPAEATVSVLDPTDSRLIARLTWATTGPPPVYRQIRFVAPAGGTVQLEVGTGAQYAVGQDFYFDLVSIAGEPYLPAMTFGCLPSDAYIGSMATRGDQSDLVNVLAAARRGGTQAVSTDTSSLALYGRHSHVQNDLELATDDERDLWASFYLIRQANPAQGVAGFSTRPDSSALSKLLGLPLGAIVRVYDEHHGPVIDKRVRWLGAKWKVAPAYVEVDVVTGEDASIRQVGRSTLIETPAQWLAAAVGPWKGDLLAYGSFEAGLAGWQWKPSGYSLATTISDATAPLGASVLKVPGSPSVPAYPGVETSPRLAVIPGVAYRLRAAAKVGLAGTGTQGAVGMHTYNAAGAMVVGNQLQLVWTVAEASAWTYREAYWTCPIDGSIATVKVEAINFHPGPGPEHVWLFDDISLRPGNVAYREPGAAPHKLPSGF